MSTKFAGFDPLPYNYLLEKGFTNSFSTRKGKVLGYFVERSLLLPLPLFSEVLEGTKKHGNVAAPTLKEHAQYINLGWCWSASSQSSLILEFFDD